MSVYIVTAGKTEKDTRSIVLFPLLRKSELNEFLERYVPDYVVPSHIEERPARSAKGHFMTLPVLLSLILAVPGLIWLPHLYKLLTILFPVIAICWGTLRYKHLGWTLQEHNLAIQYGGFSRRLVMMPKKRMQWYRVSQTIFQMKTRNATLKIGIAAGRDPAIFTVRHAPQDKVRRIAAWLTD